jgi:hAT family C-terminal dimerisation region
MYRVALDILPVQASSVACERAFSSSKETITMRRNRLSVELMEILQFLKYAYRQDRLNLMEGIISSEKDLLSAELPSVSVDDVRDLLVKGQINELIELLNC